MCACIENTWLNFLYLLSPHFDVRASILVLTLLSEFELLHYWLLFVWTFYCFKRLSTDQSTQGSLRIWKLTTTLCCELLFLSITILHFAAFQAVTRHSGKSWMVQSNFGRTGRSWRLKMLASPPCLELNYMHGSASVRLWAGVSLSLATILEKKESIASGEISRDLCLVFIVIEEFKFMTSLFMCGNFIAPWKIFVLMGQLNRRYVRQ